jgi:hypothetical protein
VAGDPSSIYWEPLTVNTRACYLLLSAAACTTPVDPTPQPATYRISPQQVWAGATVTIESAAFRELGDGAELDLGLVNVPMVRVDDTTMLATIPSTAGGIYDPAVVMGDSLALLDQVTVWGFAGSRRYGPDGVWFAWDVYVWPEGSTSILGGTLGGGLTTIDLATDEIVTWPGILSLQSIRGPGATPQDSVFLLRATGEPPRSWKLTPNPQLLAEHPEFTFTRQLLRLGTHSWILTANNRVETWTRPDSATAYTVTSIAMNESQGVHLSPRGDRATIRVAQVPFAVAGVPVFAAPSGALAYYVGLRSSTAVDWSADGALLAMAGSPPAGPATDGQVLLLQSGTGQALGSVLTGRPVFGVAIDELRPYLYAGVTSTTGRMAIQVYRRPELSLLAELDMPQTEATCGLLADCFGGVLALGPEELYAFYGWNGFTRSARFFLPPP